jgi:chaperone modulatory protein CbpM
MQPHQIQTSIARATLIEWIEVGWLRPEDTSAGREPSEADRARAQLILDLKSMGVNDEAIPIILDLVDQLHGLRRQLRLHASLAIGGKVEGLPLPPSVDRNR